MFKKHDYILEIIEAVSAALLKIVFNRENKKYEEAKQEIEKAADSLVGLKYGVIEKMSAGSLLSLLKINESTYAGRCFALAKLLKENAEILTLQGRQEDALDSAVKALYLYLEVIKDPRSRDREYLPGVYCDIRVLHKMIGVAEVPENLSKAIANIINHG